MKRIVSIDIGLNNFAAITNNINKSPVIIKGGGLKADNQLYNKKRINTVSSNENYIYAKSATEKIIRFFDKASDWIMKFCSENRIEIVVIGKYQMQNDRGNDNFVNVPFELFYDMLSVKCKYHKIEFRVIDEKYTSGTSFFDGEAPNYKNYNKTRRIHAHLWRCNDGSVVNADVNDSYQIMRKAFPFITADKQKYKREPEIIRSL